MEIRKEDLVRIRSFEDIIFYGIKLSAIDKEEIPESVEEVNVELELQKKKDAKLIEEMKLEKEKADKKAKLIAELAALED